MESSDRLKTYKLSLGLLESRLNRVAGLLLIASVVALPCNLLQPSAIAEAMPSSERGIWRSELAVSARSSFAIAQSPSLSKNTIYVNPETGDDSQAGKKTSPLKTITQALAIAEDNSTIQLAAGTYSKDTGETFPIVIENKVTLQGDPQNQGYKTIIRGDGYFISPTGAGQNVAIAAVKNAGAIIGVTVTNNHSRGHGIWVESASPKIISNTFTRNGNTGVSLNGKSSALLEDNYFYNNSGNGLLVYGNSQPEVVKNTFEQTGFGISLVRDSVAQISENLFDGNRIGIILEGNARGTLRDNEIINSQESGLTAIAQSRVDLGTDDEPGNNTFRSNKLDIQNATNSEIVAVDTQVQGDIEGNINFDRGTFVTTDNTNTFKDLPPLPARLNVESSPLPPATPALNIPDEPPSNLPAPPPVTANSGNKELIFTPPSSSDIPIPDLEPVPFAPSSSAPYTPVKYKVLVEVLDNGEEDEVRSLYPEAFETIYQGEPWLQVGAFSDWDKAKRAEQNLIELGLGTYLID